MQQITFSGLMSKLARMPAEIEAAAYEGLVKAAVEVHKTAVAKFGHYQPAYGPFEAWATLATSTLDAKLAAGSQGDDPLIGHYAGTRSKVYPVSLRQSLSMDVRRAELVAYVGTNNPIGEYQEFGTTRGIPPRPFLRPALYQNEKWIERTMKDAIGMGLITWLH